MVGDDEGEQTHFSPDDTQWKVGGVPVDEREGVDEPREFEARRLSRPGVPDPGPGAEPRLAAPPPTPKSRPWGAVLVALVGAVFCLTWWNFWWEADQTSGTERTQFAWSFLYLAAATCVYLYVVWRWLARR